MTAALAYAAIGATAVSAAALLLLHVVSPDFARRGAW